jgi:hypothetical protein
VTRGASLRTADPAPNGRSAVAMRCDHGWCDVALVDLNTGRDTVILRGSPERSFFRPRFSPDGSRLLVSMNESGRWRLVVASARTDDFHEVPVAGNVYDASWIAGDIVVATSDEDGVANLETIDVSSGQSRRLTHVSGAAVGAEVAPRDSSIWFLSLYSRGYDLRRVRAPVAGGSSMIAADTRLAPASMLPPVETPPFATNSVSAPRPFDLSARLFRWLPLPQADADGYSAVIAASSNDVIGRSEIVAKGSFGDYSAWRGAALDFIWRGFPIRHINPSRNRLPFSLPRVHRPTLRRQRHGAADTAVHLPFLVHQIKGGLTRAGSLSFSEEKISVRMVQGIGEEIENVMLQFRLEINQQVTANN